MLTKMLANAMRSRLAGCLSLKLARLAAPGGSKKHWRQPSKLEWITEGLGDLKRVIRQNHIHSVAVPPLGSGNGGLDWGEVRQQVERILGGLEDVDVVVYEPTEKYQNVAKRTGVDKLTPARALVADMI